MTLDTKVRPLIWKNPRSDGTLYASTVFGLLYTASEKGWGTARDYPCVHEVKGGIEAAKAACLDDYCNRVLSAVEPTPSRKWQTSTPTNKRRKSPPPSVLW